MTQVRRILLISSTNPHAPRQSGLGRSDVEIVSVKALPHAAKALRKFQFDAVVLAQNLSELELTWLQSEIGQLAEQPAILWLEGEGSEDLAKRLRSKSIPYRLVAELTPEALLAGLKDAHLAETQTEGPCREGGCGRTLIGDSPGMHRVREIVRLVARRRCTVLITGESGTGKEMVARALHVESDRAARSMVSVNCAAVPATLLESEMFGHEKGSFTGSVARRIGRFEEADKSTIFLDEIGDMTPELQAKILRVLQEKEIQRIGSSKVSKVDVRVVAATNRDLTAEMKAGRFRHDLYFRLRVVPLHIPPLRERREDIPVLVNHFIGKTCRREGLARKNIQPDVISYLSEQPWPGNVRELEHAIERAIALSGDRLMLGLCDFSPFCDILSIEGQSQSLFDLSEAGIDLTQVITALERSIIQEALLKADGNRARAAQILRLKRSTLVSKVKAFASLRAEVPV